jgi:ribonuclease HI
MLARYPGGRRPNVARVPETTTVYTDGAALGNPGPAGWAWIVTDGGPYASGSEPHSTNQRMEIRAVLDELQALPSDGRIHVRSDSTYVVNCFRDRWWESWIARGWLNKAKKPVANRDLWEPLIELVRTRGEVTFEWVKGHGEDPMNDLADRLCTDAARLQEGRSGVGIPDDLGPPDAPGGRRVAAVAPAREALADGRLVVITGHRPPELGGYDPNPVADKVRDRLAEILRAKRSMHDDLVVVTGMGLGTEQLAAAAGVPYVAVLAYPEPDAVWPSESRRRYERLLAGAHSTLTLQDQRPKSKQQAGTAMARRDAFLARHADEAIVVWDGTDDLVGRQVRSLRDHLGEEDVWVVEP